jgi:raffinose/stachyose/melibiose transport system permease protein
MSATRDWPQSVPSTVGYWLFMAVVIALALGPVLWVMVSSLKTGAQIFSGDSILIPKPPTLQGYSDAISGLNLPSFIGNSVLYAVLAATFTPLVAFLAAYPAARLRFPLRNPLTILISAALAIPAVGLVVPVFLVELRLGLYDSKLGMLLFYVALYFPLAFMILRAYLIALPAAIEEAAAVDGAGYFRTLVGIVLPIARSGLITVAIVVFVGVWNDFFWNLVIAPTAQNQNVQVAMAGFRSQFQFNVTGTLAGSTMVMAVPMIAFLLLQRHVIAGLVGGWSK